MFQAPLNTTRRMCSISTAGKLRKLWEGVFPVQASPAAPPASERSRTSRDGHNSGHWARGLTHIVRITGDDGVNNKFYEEVAVADSSQARMSGATIDLDAVRNVDVLRRLGGDAQIECVIQRIRHPARIATLRHPGHFIEWLSRFL